MDFSPVVNQIVSALWYLIPIAILAGVLKSPWFKGVVGEFIVNLSAKFLLDKEKNASSAEFVGSSLKNSPRA